jgi:hypothetical protein
MDFGAVHYAALNYLFPHLSNTSRIDAPDLVATFAARGVPGATGLPPWPLFKDGTHVMRLEPGQSAAYAASAYHGCSFWRDLFPEQLS